MDDVTRILQAIDRGDAQAAGQLLPLLYDELRRQAAHQLASEKPGQTLQPTALVHEAYLRLVGQADEARWQNRGHFFAAAAEAMRRILIDNVRKKRSQKHGGDRVRQPLDPDDVALPEASEDLLVLDEALTKLKEQEPEAAELVQLRYFAGLTIKQAAAVLGMSPRSADFLWAFARAWLLAKLQGTQ